MILFAKALPALVTTVGPILSCKLPKKTPPTTALGACAEFVAELTAVLPPLYSRRKVAVTPPWVKPAGRLLP